MLFGAVLLAVAVVALQVRILEQCRGRTPEGLVVDLRHPVREEPARFPPQTHLPTIPEALASGSIDLSTFDPRRDLIEIHDGRVWWESDHDDDDSENDHAIHRSMEVPLRRLINLCAARGVHLKVHDAYRERAIHANRSLHKEGRAIDLTTEDRNLEALAKLCWAAGFDWVFYESPKSGGAHVHCSVRRSRITGRPGARVLNPTGDAAQIWIPSE